MAIRLEQGEREAMEAAKIAVFEDRLILDAEPPIDDSTLDRIGRHCAGPLPEDLVALWKTSFGGRLDYCAWLPVNGTELPFSLSELFRPGSDGYLDLWGWIESAEESEREGAERDGKRWDGRLHLLPFGGFEHSDRAYAVVKPGDDHGAIVGLMQGPAWLRTGEGRLAGSLRSFFKSFALEDDPRAARAGNCGHRMFSALDELEVLGTSGKRAAEKLRALVLATVLDWRAALAAGAIAGDGRLRRLCLARAAETDDVSTLTRLQSLGCDLGEPLTGGGRSIDTALVHGAMRAVRLLLDANVPVSNALIAGAHNSDVELARELISKGAKVDRLALHSAIDGGRLEVAELFLASLGEVHDLQMSIRARNRAFELRQLAKNPPPDRTADALRARATAFDEVADRIDPTLKR